ncbi:MAG: hypothetical protein PUE86_08165 [Prevotella sp.]|nr:hypothetical protein [Prevotella sp.]
MKTVNSLKRTFVKVAMIVMAAIGSWHNMYAQDVVVSPETGKFVAALTKGSEEGFEKGWSSLWRHDQLPLSLTVADDGALNSGGEFRNPAGNLLKKDGGTFYISGGAPYDGYIILSMPKGYRITSYEIVLVNDNVGQEIQGLDIAKITKSFYETGSNFRYQNPKATATAPDGNTVMKSYAENTEYTIKRTATSKDDMGDHLYFTIHHEDEGFFALTVKSFQITFAADNDVTINVRPTASSNTAVSVTTSPFDVGSSDLGPIKPNTKNGKTYYSYSYANVKSLKANMTLFQEDAVSEGVATENVATTKKINTVNKGGWFRPSYYYSLGTGTYYVESPTAAISQNNISLPLGYRITGATIYGRKNTNNDNDFTIRLYDKDGVSYTDYTVNSTTDQAFSVDDMNNDAVKFEIRGSNNALVYLDVKMQALNPYIYSMDVVCHDELGYTLTNTFTASNFSVRGGKFTFYVPDKSKGNWKFTFENLRSNYADNTYYDGTGIGKSRYNFVASPYWKTAYNLYNADYDPDHTYTDKVRVEKVGNYPFRFNNADELDNNSTDTQIRYWTEHPFSIQEYQKQNNVENPFGDMTVQEGKTGNAYLFTADETRYNIAPTTASEHRNYAFYHMEVDVIKKTYTPVVELTPLYGTTCYDGDAELAHYGVKITTINADKTPVEGYLTSEQIATAINNKIAEAGISASQILYVDASELLNVYQPDKLKELQAKLGKNALLYLPQYTTLASNNCATKTLAGTFTSCSNIILTDKHPFYAPYDISVSASDYVKYDRMMTVVNSQEYGQSANATIMLPFTLNLDENAMHRNLDYNGNPVNNVTFTVKTLQADNCMSYTNEPAGNPIDYYENYAHFVDYTGTLTEANKPYMVHVVNAPAETSCLFTALQYGATIKATSGMNGTDYTFNGDNATGTLANTACTFTPKASYAGNKLDKTGNYFYFAKNWFLCSKNIVSGPWLYVYPFRGYFMYEGSTSASRFGIVFDENNKQTDGIENTLTGDNSNGISVSTGDRAIIIAAPADTTIRITHVGGSVMTKLSLKAGEQQTVSVPAGIYIVNDRKVVVK